MRSGQNTVVTSIATAMSGEHSSQILRSCSTFRRTWGRILRSRFSPNFCSFARIFLAGWKFFRSSGSLDSRSKYLQFPIPRREGQLGSCWGVGLGISGPPSPLSLSTTRVMSPGQHCPYLGELPPFLNVKGPQIGQICFFRGSKSWSMIYISLKKQIKGML